MTSQGAVRAGGGRPRARGQVISAIGPAPCPARHWLARARAHAPHPPPSVRLDTSPRRTALQSIESLCRVLNRFVEY